MVASRRRCFGELLRHLGGGDPEVRAVALEGDVIQEAEGIDGEAAGSPGELAVLDEMEQVGNVGLVGAWRKAAQGHVANHTGAELGHGTPPSVRVNGMMEVILLEVTSGRGRAGRLKLAPSCSTIELPSQRF